LSSAAASETLARARELIGRARFDEAEAALEGLLSATESPELHREVLYALAVARRYARRAEAALGVLARLNEQEPEFGRGFQELGHTLCALDRSDEAAAAYARAVALNPGLLASWRALVGLHEAGGRRDLAERARGQMQALEALPKPLQQVVDLVGEERLHKAEKRCREFLKQHPDHVEGMRLLADIGMRLKIFDDAEFLLESCVAFAPEHVGARRDYLRVLNRKGKFAAALAQAEELCRLEPEAPVHQLAKANALTGLGRFDEGIELYERCLHEPLDRPGTLLLLGHARKAVGDIDGAIAAYREAGAERPSLGDAAWSLANTKTYRFDDGELAALSASAHDDALPAPERIHFCFALGKALEDRGDYAASFAAYERGNALKAARSGYSAEATAAMVDAQIRHCDAALFRDRGDAGCPAPDPIFIVGLPRSGSTLLEQILASHSQIDGTLELHNVLGVAQRLGGRSAAGASRYPANLAEIDPDYFRRFGERFLEDTRVYRQGAPRFIDKMPNNFLHIGLIRLMLPNAKVIDARREPMACCFSNFKQLFGEGQEFSYGLERMGCYYRDYERLMAHWDQVLPGWLLRVQHEDVLDDLEGQVRRMLDFLDLPFEPACLRYWETERAVRTPSSEQVRQPIFRTAQEQWHNYAPWLQPLRDALGEGLAPAGA